MVSQKNAGRRGAPPVEVAFWHGRIVRDVWSVASQNLMDRLTAGA
jgi:hypothetical protein